MRWWSCESYSVLECPSPLPHSVPILASPDPDGERVSFRTFWICCAVTVNCTSLALNLSGVAWVILFHLRFLFIRLPSSRRCGLAETVGLCFRVDSDRATLGFVLGLVCVCVFVLFCSVVVVLFVVGRQQHCRYIGIDAMVCPRNWILEDELSTGKTLGVFGLILVFQHLAFATEKILNLGATTSCMNRTRWVFGRYLIVYLVFWKYTYFCRYLLIMDMIWNVNIFFLPGTEVKWSEWVDEMSCRKGVWKFDTLCEHPLGKGEATCHSSLVV